MLIGYGRVSTDQQKTDRQRDALNRAGCTRVYEEKLSGTRKVEDRPALMEALDYMRDDDMLCVQEADRLGRNLLDGLLTLAALFERGVPVRILEGIAAGDHTERSLVLDLALALAEDRARDIRRKTRDGLAAARARGRVGGRPQRLNAIQAARAQQWYDEGEMTVGQIASMFRVPRSTVYGYLDTTKRRDRV